VKSHRVRALCRVHGNRRGVEPWPVRRGISVPRNTRGRAHLVPAWWRSRRCPVMAAPRG
jgi:hypothetical protein